MGCLVAFPWAWSRRVRAYYGDPGEAEGDREVRVDVVCVGTEREAMPPSRTRRTLTTGLTGARDYAPFPVSPR